MGLPIGLLQDAQRAALLHHRLLRRGPLAVLHQQPRVRARVHAHLRPATHTVRHAGDMAAVRDEVRVLPALGHLLGVRQHERARHQFQLTAVAGGAAAVAATAGADLLTDGAAWHDLGLFRAVRPAHGADAPDRCTLDGSRRERAQVGAYTRRCLDEPIGPILWQRAPAGGRRAAAVAARAAKEAARRKGGGTPGSEGGEPAITVRRRGRHPRS
mmetsp:Transcript_46214/g.116985  ORF Transcript_46214/g.116985 Transcript_46214/m.116985 type:complete len:214 (+) Transcript_46214:610-1251(+)